LSAAPRRRPDCIAAAILLLLPAIYFFDVVLGRSAFFFIDLLRFTHPAKKVLRDIVLGGEFPYWNPLLSAGQPLAANPQSEVFYPLNWLIFLPSYDYGFQLLILVHLAIALVAMYALLRSLKLQPAVAAIGAISYGLGGVMLSLHQLLPILFSAAWLPLTCLYARRAIVEWRVRDFALASLFLGLQFLVGEPATLLQTAIVIAVFALFRGIREKRVVAALLIAAAIGVAGLFAGAAQMLPALDHARDSVRSRGIPWEMAKVWSLPPIRLGELFYPNLLGHMTRGDRVLFSGAAAYGDRNSPYLFNIYPGLLISVLALAGFARRIRGWPLAAALLAVGLLFALGEHTPFVRILYDSGLTFLRYFEKFMLLAVFALIVFGARALQNMVDGDRQLRAAAMIVAAIVTAIAVVFAFRGAAMPIDWWLAALRGGALLLLLAVFPRVRHPLVWAVFLIADLTPVIREITPRADVSLYESMPIAAQKLRQWPASQFRIFHEAEWDSASTDRYAQSIGLHLEPMRNAMLPPIANEFGLATVMENDYDLTTLLPTDEFVASMATIGHRSKSGWPQPMAAMSNAWIRTQYRPIEDAVARARGDYRQMQPAAFLPLARQPRYYFASDVVAIRGKDDFVQLLTTQRYANDVAFANIAAFRPSRGIVRTVEESANRIRIEADVIPSVSEGPGGAGLRGTGVAPLPPRSLATLGMTSQDIRGFLVLSVTPHKYWRVRVDGVEAKPIVTNLGYQGLVLGRGRHVIEMRYRNPLIVLGVGISLVTLLALVLMVHFLKTPTPGAEAGTGTGPGF
jgi:hypothetical protein